MIGDEQFDKAVQLLRDWLARNREIRRRKQIRQARAKELGRAPARHASYPWQEEGTPLQTRVEGSA